MRKLRVLIWHWFLAGAVVGCASNSRREAPAPPMAVAASVVVQPVAGDSVFGLVTRGVAQPLVGVRVQSADSAVGATTDEAGRFVLRDMVSRRDLEVVLGGSVRQRLSLPDSGGAFVQVTLPTGRAICLSILGVEAEVFRFWVEPHLAGTQTAIDDDLVVRAVRVDGVGESITRRSMPPIEVTVPRAGSYRITASAEGYRDWESIVSIGGEWL